jgi:hypothetical protein
VLADDFVDFGIWNNVNTERRHRFNCNDNLLALLFMS